MAQPKSRVSNMFAIDPATGKTVLRDELQMRNLAGELQGQYNVEAEKLAGMKRPRLNDAQRFLSGSVGKVGESMSRQLQEQELNKVGRQLEAAKAGRQGLIYDRDSREERLRDVNREYGQMIQQGPTGQARAYQQQLLSQIPQSPMASQAMLRNQQNQNMQQALAMARSGQSPSAANLMARNALQAQGMANQQAFGQGLGQAAQEMGQLNQFRLGGTTQGRAQDAAYEMMARQGQQQTQAQSLDQAKAMLQAQTQRELGAAQARAAQRAAKNQQQNSMLGTVAQVGALALMAFSDEKVKKNIQTGRKAVENFLDGLKAHKYEYKNPEHGEGEHVSVMAQELEKSEIGEKMVVDTPEGKMVDYGKGLPAMLAAQALLHEKIKKLEKDRG